jgi:hypothetical protein
MPSTANPGRAARRPQPFILYAAQDRVYARNRDTKLIDLGSLTRDESGAFCYLLDGNQQSGGGFFTVEAALQDIAEKVRFLWLDGQFTAVADASGSARLDGVPQLDFILDELEPGERAYDATV